METRRLKPFRIEINKILEKNATLMQTNLDNNHATIREEILRYFGKLRFHLVYVFEMHSSIEKQPRS